MKNKELFDRTIGILVNAYFKGTLEHYNCCACAVGNLVAANCGYTYNESMKYNEAPAVNKDYGWAALFATTDRIQKYKPENIGMPATKYQIDSTGYSHKELMKIEFSFEYDFFHGFTEAELFKGLMNVVDTLMQIHEASTEEITAAKQLFTHA